MSGFNDVYYSSYHKTKLLIGIMNKNVMIGSLCIFIILIIGLLYFTKVKEGFVDAIVAAATALAKAKQEVTQTNAAVDSAKKAVGSSTEISTAKDAYMKATNTVIAANNAVKDTHSILDVSNLAEFEKNANTAKTNWSNLQKVIADKNAAGSEYRRAEADVNPANPNSAVAKVAAAKARFDALPN
jgi:hypothetical protein